MAQSMKVARYNGIESSSCSLDFRTELKSGLVLNAVLQSDLLPGANNSGCFWIIRLLSDGGYRGRISHGHRRWRPRYVRYNFQQETYLQTSVMGAVFSPHKWSTA